jgi:YVTN family beta-propeller protein
VTGHVFVVDGDSATVSVIDPKSDQAIATVNGGGGLEYAVADGAGKVYVNGAEKKEIVRIDVRTNMVDARWPITGCTNPHGLAIDPASHRLFASCANQVMAVIDTTNGSSVATLPIGQGTDAAAFDPSHKRAFSSNSEGTVTVIGQKSGAYAVLDTVPTQVTGRTMGVDPVSGRLFVAAADVDPNAKPAPGPGGRPGRPKALPGSLKLLFLDPVR